MVKILKKRVSKCLVIPPFTPFAGGFEIRKLISRRTSDGRERTLPLPLHDGAQMDPKVLPPSSKVRRESSNAKIETHWPKRIGAKEFMDIGDRIFLPKSVNGKRPSRIEEKLSSHDEEDLKVVRGLELYKSGLGINRSLDVLASKYLRYDYEESPRLT